jgi:hypothetical protein
MAQSAHSRPAISTPGHTSLPHSEADRSGGRPPPEADRSDGIPIRKQTDPTAYRSEGRAGAPACPPQPNHRSPARVPRSARDPPGAEREARGASTGTPETSSMPREERRGRSTTPAPLMGHHRGHKPRTRGPAISTPGHTSLRHPEKQTAPRADRAEGGVGAPACPARAGSALRAGQAAACHRPPGAECRVRGAGRRALAAECRARVAGRRARALRREARRASRRSPETSSTSRGGAPRTPKDPAALTRHRRRHKPRTRGPTISPPGHTSLHHPKADHPESRPLGGQTHPKAGPTHLPGRPPGRTAATLVEPTSSPC